MNIRPTTGYNINNKISNNTIPAFKGKGEKEAGKITKWLADKYGRAMLNSSGIRKSSKWLSKVPGDATQHLQVAGSFITSSAYVMSTLKNKNFDKENANTLAINQTACFVVPTAGGYTVNALIAEINKQLEYKYSAIQERKLATSKMTALEKEAAVKKLSQRLKGFRTLMGIVTFAMMYRYISPVLVTPLSNKLGRKLNAKIKEKEVKPKEIQMQSENKKLITAA